MVFEYFAKKLFGYEEAKASKKLRESYNAFLDGLISFPLNIPGTAFHACLKVHKIIRLIKLKGLNVLTENIRRIIIILFDFISKLSKSWFDFIINIYPFILTILLL